MLQEKYGKGIKRRTSYDEIEQIDASAVVSANQRLYVNREDGFIGLNWRQHEFVTECTILDSVAHASWRDGSLKVAKVADKIFMGRDIIHVAIWPKEGDTNFYTMVYQDKETGKAFAKKFQIGGLSPRQALPARAKPKDSSVVYLEVSDRRRKCRRACTSPSTAAAAPGSANSISTSHRSPSAPAPPKASPSPSGRSRKCGPPDSASP